MTGKRFINDIDIGQLIDTKGELSTIDYSDKVDFYELWEFLNKLNDENEQLKEAREYYQENFLTMKTERNQFKRENELLKFQLDECRNNKLFSRRELEKENEQLQKSLSASVEKNRKLQTILDKLGYTYMGDLK